MLIALLAADDRSVSDQLSRSRLQTPLNVLDLGVFFDVKHSFWSNVWFWFWIFFFFFVSLIAKEFFNLIQSLRNTLSL